MTRVVCIADPHGYHSQIKIPDGDILICAGDVTAVGKTTQLRQFCEWYADLPHKHKIFIAGNHDFCLQFGNSGYDTALEIIKNSNFTYLKDSFITCEGLKIYGSPWQPWFHDWAFNLKHGSEIAVRWARIPDDTDILVTHGPPENILDETIDTGYHVGCLDLLQRIHQLPKLKLHIFGHIHEGYGMEKQCNVTYVNASSVGINYRPINNPIVVDI